MKYLLLILLIPTISVAQKKLNRKIVITESDSTGIYEKVRQSFVKSGYLLLDNRNADTLITYGKEYSKLGFIIFKAAIKENTVTYWGYYGLKSQDAFGYTNNTSQDAKPILDFGGSIAWKELKRVASKLSKEMTF